MTEIRYARSGDLSIAYRVEGQGPPDVVVVPGYVSHVEMSWETPPTARAWERLTSFSRTITFDKRGTGLSDPITDDNLPGLEQRMDDVRAVMEAVESKRAVLFGHSEGAMMSMLFAATYPERTEALILYGGMARATWSEDHPWNTPREALIGNADERESYWGTGIGPEIFAPSVADDPGVKEWSARYERACASPRNFRLLSEMFLDLDVREIVSSIHVPTLILHRTHDRVVNIRSGRWLAEHIPGARLVEMPGIDHSIWVGEADRVLDEVEEFVTGKREQVEPDRVLKTIMFTDIVGSTERAAAMGDGAWRDLLASHDAFMRKQIDRFRGITVKQLGDGVLACFDGPARAIRCGASAARAAADAGFPIRVGIHTGECEMVGDDVAGLTVHIAARVGVLADKGEVLVSRTVKDLVAGSGIAFEPRGTHALKGVPDEWQLYAVASA
ncbi:MAG TPA: adenylate/guanylate cyclase domain-containing protein [Actinomycetota bacterium]